MTQEEYYMSLALAQARVAGLEGEVPIGAVVVRDGQVVGWGRNQRELGKDALAHAEIQAIHMACQNLKGWRLMDCDLYVTLEPCPMCAGAIINSRIRHVYYGAKDHRFGACGSVTDLFSVAFNHQPLCTPGVLEGPCQQMLSEFFSALRYRKKQGLEVRRASGSLKEGAWQLWQQSGMAEAYPWTKEEFIKKMYTGFCVVMLQQGQPIAVATLDHHSHYSLVLCREDHRGHGVAATLCQYLERKAMLVQRSHLTAPLEPQGFWKQLGFEERDGQMKKTLELEFPPKGEEDRHGL